jgi:hypothetical protein
MGSNVGEASNRRENRVPRGGSRSYDEEDAPALWCENGGIGDGSERRAVEDHAVILCRRFVEKSGELLSMQ